MKMKINNQTNLDLSELEQQVDRFYPYSKQQLGFQQDPQSINFVSDPENATDMLGKTAFYDPESFSITIYADNRHPKDMMRSLSHELVHHAQNCRGEFDNEMDLGEGYAQEDEHMRNMEKEAYSLGNIVFRDWEDNMKKVNEITSYSKDGKSFRRNRELDSTGDVSSSVPARAVKGARFLTNFITKHPNMEPNDNRTLEQLITIQNQRELARDEKDTAMMIINKYKASVSEMIATPDTVKDAIKTNGDEDVSELEEVSWQGIKDKVKGAVGMMPSARNAYKSPSGHVIWNIDRALKGFFPWQLAKQKGNKWVMIPNGKNNKGIPESPFMTQQEASKLEDLGADGLSRLAGKIQVPWFKGQKAPSDWIKLLAKNPEAGFDGVYFIKGKQDFEGADKMMANLRQLQSADLEAQWARGREEREKAKAQKKFAGSPGEYRGKPSGPNNVAIAGSSDTQSHGFDAGDNAKWNENLTLREAKIMSKRNKLEEMVLEYCQTKNFKTLSEVKQVRKVVEKILKENKEKADTANLYEAPVTEADLEEEIELDEIITGDDEQTGNSRDEAEAMAKRTYSKDGKEDSLRAQKKSMGIYEEDVVEEEVIEEDDLEEVSKPTGNKSRDRDEPDRRHRMESKKVPAKKSAQQIQESKFDKKFHDLVAKWCK